MLARSFVAVSVFAVSASAQSPQLGIWNFDSSSGFAAIDSSARGNHGVLRNFTNDPAQWVVGRFGNALRFDGVDDVVEFAPANGLPFFTGGGEAFSVCVWVRAAPGDDQVVLALGSSTATSTAFAIGSGRASLGTAGRVQLRVRNDAAVASTRTSQGVAFDGAWHHLAYVEQAGQGRLYLDGVLDPANFDDRFGVRGARTPAYGGYPFDTISLGGTRSLCCPLAGTLDELQVYATALSASDVAAIVAGGAATRYRASVGELGVGCGPAPLELFALGVPAIGGRGVTFAMRGGHPGGIALLGVDVGRVVPADLSRFGFPGCSLYSTDPEFVAMGVFDAGGSIASAQLPVPITANLDGVRFVFQGVAASPAGIAFSQALVAQIGTLANRQRSFDFTSEALMDRAQSGGAWIGGAGSFAELGGDGRHGDFALSDGQPSSATHWLFSTDSQRITAKPSTASASDVTVSDGTFFFTSFVVPAGITVEFTGSKPVRLHVRGECRIEGTLLGAGESPIATFAIKAPIGHGAGGWPGQAAGRGGPSGGRGGAGAFGCDGTGNPNQPAFNNFNGFDGEALQVPAGHVLSGAVSGTPGHGSSLFPAHGDHAQLRFNDPGSFNFDLECAASGGGGGFVVAGGAGTCTEAGSVNNPNPNTNPLRRGPSASGGMAVAFGPLPFGVSSSDYYLVGGAGGGGGASQPLFSQTGEVFKYRSGSAGGGGGGAIRLSVGGDFDALTGSRIDVRGGSAAVVSLATANTRGAPTPGGGGSGGTILLQVVGARAMNGAIDVRGGDGGRYASGVFRASAGGGIGGAGFLRVETPNQAPSLPSLGTVEPPAVADNAGVLVERDQRAGFQSVWVSCGALTAPLWVRYVVRADVDGIPRVFSDDPTLGPPAAEGSAPLVFLVQGADTDLAGALLAEPRIGRWHAQVGAFDPSRGSLEADARLGFRWRLSIDRTLSADVVVREVHVEFRD
ncbi:MAG: LamG domain-containing protein [Planctomycetes bacterium]|nr:LamG domain-containing protein [Planctomycetota bacterium]